MILNVVFHNIVKHSRDIDDKDFTLTLEKYNKIINILEDFVAKKFVDDIRIYFDDGHQSFYSLVIPHSKKLLSKFVFAVTTDFIGRKGFIKPEELMRTKKMGIKIVSHGVSHTALVIYDKTDRHILKTKTGGRYKNIPFGKVKALSENEVLFQYKESKQALEKVIKNVDEFVFPFGLYNKSVIRVNERNGIYKYLSTCDEFLDKGESIRPRYLIYNTKSFERIWSELINLKQKK